jgi:hypothetical protein
MPNGTPPQSASQQQPSSQMTWNDMLALIMPALAMGSGVAAWGELHGRTL